MLSGHKPGDEYLGLARLACDVGDDAPQAPVAASVAAMLDRLDRYADEVGRPRPGMPWAPGAQLAIAAAVVARTPDVPLPEVGEDVGEREEGAA